MKVLVVGSEGYVGINTVKLFEKFHKVVKYDISLSIKPSSKTMNECDLAIICVPTNQDPDTGKCDTSIVESCVNWLKNPLILIKSTVSPGTTKKFAEETGKRIVFSPEFVGETKYGDGVYNFGMNLQAQPFYIFGGEKKDTDELVSIYSEMCGPDRSYRQTDSTTAEMVKYMDNSYFSTKLTFFYEIDQLCKNSNINYNEVREGVCLDPRINKWHTTVFKNNTTPFGGKCLPKDTQAIIYSSTERGYTPKLLEETMKSNQRIGAIRQSTLSSQNQSSSSNN